ncbi:glycosyltransferase [Fodinibius salsisoli]|uniref:Glycosyltransferase n=1 Tax=Fodinibius salsisoli TaxID=2820877 RepID=A0ABT3PJB6_9BACT|nr:glycosyltransferase [Fodinibius salsisoli]MCW9706035.1 glycosyltransferase [Fodinibius salsisoli]
MKTAIVTDFLNQFGGAEIVTHQIATLFPQADIYTMFGEQQVMDTYFEGHRVIEHPKIKDSSWRQKHYRKLLPLYPTYVEDFDLTGYDLIISSSYLWAKGVLSRPDTLHISYVHTPMRQAWVKYHEYLQNENDIGKLTRTALRYVMNYLRIWDVSTANRVDHFIANSTTVQKRIEDIYRREATVIHPPIQVQQYRDKHKGVEQKEHYITVGRLVPYKRVDILIEAFNQSPDRELYIAGAGNDRDRLESLVQSDNIHFLGFVDEDTKTKLIAQAKAFLFAAEEDFGMSPVEAMSLGTPVIGYGQGGTRDYIQDGINGCFFEEQTPESLLQTISVFEETEFDSQTVKQSVTKFDEAHFRQQIQSFIEGKLKD